jgi:hypothetical protein
MRFRKTLISLTLATGLVFALPAVAQQKPMTQDQVQALVRDGFGDESGAKLIEQRGIDFAPAEEFLQKLKSAGASETFLGALRAAKPPEPPSAPATAELIVETSPNAEVFLDGVSQGHAHGEGGLNTRAKPGTHTLKVSLKGKKDFEQNITLAPLQVTRIEARLKDLTSMPGTGGEVIYPKAAEEPTPTPPTLSPPWLAAKPQGQEPAPTPAPIGHWSVELSETFKESGMRAYHALDRVDPREAALSYEPRQLDAEKALDEAGDKAASDYDKHALELLRAWGFFNVRQHDNWISQQQLSVARPDLEQIRQSTINIKQRIPLLNGQLQCYKEATLIFKPDTFNPKGREDIQKASEGPENCLQLLKRITE